MNTYQFIAGQDQQEVERKVRRFARKYKGRLVEAITGAGQNIAVRKGIIVGYNIHGEILFYCESHVTGPLVGMKLPAINLPKITSIEWTNEYTDDDYDYMFIKDDDKVGSYIYYTEQCEVTDEQELKEELKQLIKVLEL